jgi:hypothetical protein
MATKNHLTAADPEIEAINIVFNALKSLDTGAQIRVIDYVGGKLGIRRSASSAEERALGVGLADAQTTNEPDRPSASHEGLADSSDEISSVAQKWLARNNLKPAQLGKLFSLGGDEIDLIAPSVPGESKRTRMRNVVLLKGVAAYLGSGAARVSYQEIKETCLHYDAFDAPNFATHLKNFSAEVSGAKGLGYTLTPRGLAAATELVRQMTQADQE